MSRQSSRVKYQGKIVRVTVENVMLPDGRTFELERVWHPGGAAAVAIDGDGRICLLRQYRPVADGWMWEIPAGKRDQVEDPLQTIHRELREEAGITANQWTSLGRYYSSPGIFDEVIHLWLARDLSQGERQPEPHELIEVHWVEADRAMAMADSGEIDDGKTLIALCRVRELLRRGG